jgi:hypothetical protein
MRVDVIAVTFKHIKIGRMPLRTKIKAANHIEQQVPKVALPTLLFMQ